MTNFWSLRNKAMWINETIQIFNQFNEGPTTLSAWSICTQGWENWNPEKEESLCKWGQDETILLLFIPSPQISTKNIIHMHPRRYNKKGPGLQVRGWALILPQSQKGDRSHWNSPGFRFLVYKRSGLGDASQRAYLIIRFQDSIAMK